MEAAALTNAALRLFFFSSRRRHTRWPRDWSSDVCSSDLHKKFLASLVRQQGWSVGDALDFQKDLQLYEDLLRSEERREGKSVDLGGGGTMKKKKSWASASKESTQ